MILPKIFEWDEKFWKEREKFWKERQDYLKQINQKNTEMPIFWHGDYFRRYFFPEIIRILLRKEPVLFQAFEPFQKYIKDCEKKLSVIKDQEEREKYQEYIKNIFVYFCPTFFDEIGGAPLGDDIWVHRFPSEWKITMENIKNRKNRVPKIILQEFIRWSKNRISTNHPAPPNVNKNLSDVISNIFPSVHASIFMEFLMLFYSQNVEDALRKNPNFYISPPHEADHVTIRDNEEEQNKKMREILDKRERVQKKETIQIILKYFHSWRILKITWDDVDKNEWDNADDEKQEQIFKQAQKKNFEKLKNELESEKIKKICEENERKERRRRYCLELINLLLVETEK